MTSAEAQELLAQCGEGVYGLCLHLGRDRERAEELFQASFARALDKRLPAPPGTRAAYNWLYTLCLNLYRSQYRKERRHNRQSVDLSAQGWDQLPQTGETGPEQQAVRKWEHAALRAAVQQLPDAYRLPVLLYYWADWDTVEIARVLRLPPATVRTRLRRAREQIRFQMQQGGMEDD